MTLILGLGVVSLLFNALCTARVIRPLYFHCKRRLEGISTEPVFRPPSVSIWSLILCIASFLIFISYLAVYCKNNILSIIVSVIFNISLLLFLVLIKPLQYEANQILQNNNLNVGYGCALWYYHNYLNKIRERFVERVNKFETEQEVELIPKLFILFPLSGIIRDYIDNTDYIQRCRELFTFSIDYSGTHNRDYNLTVYEIEPFSGNSVRCIIEFAQPLKALKHFQKFSNLSESDMCVEREILYKTLKELLKNDVNFNHFELVQYDDINSELHEVMNEVVRKHKEI